VRGSRACGLALTRVARSPASSRSSQVGSGWTRSERDQIDQGPLQRACSCSGLAWLWHRSLPACHVWFLFPTSSTTFHGPPSLPTVVACLREAGGIDLHDLLDDQRFFVNGCAGLALALCSPVSNHSHPSTIILQKETDNELLR